MSRIGIMTTDSRTLTGFVRDPRRVNATTYRVFERVTTQESAGGAAIIRPVPRNDSMHFAGVFDPDSPGGVKNNPIFILNIYYYRPLCIYKQSSHQTLLC